jgi:hypothetical protein
VFQIINNDDNNDDDDDNNNNNKPYNVNSAHVEYDSESNTSNNRATGTISKSLRQYLNNVPGKHEINQLKKCLALHIYCRK